MEEIKDTITKVIKSLEEKKNASGGADIEDVLKKVLTKSEIKHIKIQYFRSGVLGLAVDSSAWMYAITLRKQVLLAAFEAASCAVKDVRLSIGAIT